MHFCDNFFSAVVGTITVITIITGITVVSYRNS